MVLFTIGLLTLLILGVVVVFAVSAIGAGAILLFGDVIVCGLFIAGLIWFCSKRKAKKRKKKN